MIDYFSQYSGTELLLIIVAFFTVIILASTLHELAHAYVAHKNGDPTPKALGRLTFNPLTHIDPLGFIMFIFIGFGWAKPVSINPLKFRNYRKGMFFTAIAGVVVNYTLAFIAYGLYLVLLFYGLGMSYSIFFFLSNLLHFMVVINIALFVFNLIPIPPLDGFRVIETFTKYNNKFVAFMYKYGLFIGLGLLLVIFNIELSNGKSVFEFLIDSARYPIEMFWLWVFGVI